jgi:glucokinase
MTGGRTAIGVDVGGTNIRVARVSADGRILQKVAGRSDADPAIALERIVEMIRVVDAPDVTAIGIGIPGRVDYRQRLVLSGGYLDLSRVEAAKWIEDQTGKPVVIDNDCSMALVAEAAVGAAKGFRNIVMLTIGTGIGGAIMENDRIVRGARSAGQLGHITVDFNGRSCACGRRGCVETEASGTALGRHIEQAGYPAGTRADALLALCRSGEEKALGVVRCWAANPCVPRSIRSRRHWIRKSSCWAAAWALRRVRRWTSFPANPPGSRLTSARHPCATMPA